MKKVRSNQAITLIALIITVIIMLILAGIGINMAIGDHGILERHNKVHKYIKMQPIMN